MLQRLACSFVLAGAALALFGGHGASAQSVAPNSLAQIDGSGRYPRVIRVSGHLLASTDPPRLGIVSRERLFVSDDAGRSWRRFGGIPLVDGLEMHGGGTLYWLPRRVGRFQAGTLLFAAQYQAPNGFAIGWFSSSDLGRLWVYRGTPVVGGDARHGLWEPEFSVASDGALVLFWSDESDPRHSQKLAEMRTYDGVRWQDKRDLVTGPLQADRPGMAIVSRLPDGHYFLTYELVGPTGRAAVMFRISHDGWNFGPAGAPGVRAQDAAGHYFKATPFNAPTRATSTRRGRIMLVGRDLMNDDGSPSGMGGQKIFIKDDPERPGPWTMIDAPVRVSGFSENPCMNYSSDLLPSPDGLSVLELTSDRSPGGCTTWAGRLGLKAP